MRLFLGLDLAVCKHLINCFVIHRNLHSIPYWCPIKIIIGGAENQLFKGRNERMCNVNLCLDKIIASCVLKATSAVSL